MIRSDWKQPRARLLLGSFIVAAIVGGVPSEAQAWSCEYEVAVILKVSSVVVVDGPGNAADEAARWETLTEVEPIFVGPGDQSIYFDDSELYYEAAS